MKKLFIVLIMLLCATGVATADTTIYGGSSGTGVSTASDCSTYTTQGQVCQDTDDNKVYVGTGSGVVELIQQGSDSSPTGTWDWTGATVTYGGNLGNLSGATAPTGASLYGYDGTSTYGFFSSWSTTIADTTFIPVAWMIDGAAPPDALATVDLGTRQVKARTFAGDTADEDLEFFFQAPLDIIDGDTGTAGFQVKWRPIFVITSATAPAAGEGVAFALQSCSSGNGDTGDCTVGTAAVIADADLDAHARYDIVYGGWTAMTVTDGAAGEAWMMKLYRDQDNAIDDYAQLVGLIGVELKYKRTMNASGY